MAVYRRSIGAQTTMLTPQHNARSFTHPHLRLGWVYSLYPESGSRWRVWSGFVAAGVEILRRGMWAALRVEKEEREGHKMERGWGEEEGKITVELACIAGLFALGCALLT